jgi:hypothetical protein
MRIQRRAGQSHGGPGRIDHRMALRCPIEVGVDTGSAQALVIGDDHGEPARHHGRDEPLLVAVGDVEAARVVDALVEQARRRALVALAVGADRQGDQRARPLTRPRVVRLEIGAGDGDGSAVGIGTEIHDPGTRCNVGTQLTGRLQHHPGRLGADQVAGPTRRQRVRRSVELGVLTFVGARHTTTSHGGENEQQHDYNR